MEESSESTEGSNMESKRLTNQGIFALTMPPHRLSKNAMILQILSDCVAKMKLSMIIPQIFENPITVSQCLHDTPYEDCAQALLKYLRTRDKNPVKDAQLHNYYDKNLLMLIEDLLENFQMIKHLPNWFRNTSVTDHTALEAIALLNYVGDVRLHRTAARELEKEKESHKLYRENLPLSEEIESLRRKVRSHRQQLRWKIAARSGDAFKMQEELTAKKWQNFNLLRHEQVENARRIKKALFGHSNKVAQLEEEIRQLSEQNMKKNLVNSKQLKQVREEKNKLLIQLQSTIEKHDRVLCEKVKENVYLQDEYEKQREEMDAFMVGFLAIEKEYQDVVQVEQAEHDRIWQEKANFFFWTRAVRILQKHWRRWLRENKKLKAKPKGKTTKAAKGKKK